ncbi:hypothetical protein F5X99DRAFT_374474 [Biscogniauxia marginata]|nr:hypothetical protein F5X99DRAFT_374474 [Biscogniauxia marginata]
MNSADRDPGIDLDHDGISKNVLRGSSADPSTSGLEEAATSSPSLGTVSKEPPDVLPGLPRLDYRLLEHKTKLFLVSGLLIFEGSILPLILYYPLWFYTDLRHGIIFAIITSFFGIISGLEFAHRSWRLIHKTDTYRPLGGKRWHFDFTHLTLSVGYTIMTGILIGASVPHEPLVRPLAMPVPLFFIQIGSQCIVTAWMNARGMLTTCRVSSVPKGAPIPPLVLTLVEDIVAVDGGAGRVYRERVLERYKMSRRFRSMIKGLNWFWGIGSVLVGVGSMVVVWTVPEEIAYGVGWGAPLIFATLWTIITVIWTRRSLRTEKKLWLEDSKATGEPPELAPGSQGVGIK